MVHHLIHRRTADVDDACRIFERNAFHRDRNAHSRILRAIDRDISAVSKRFFIGRARIRIRRNIRCCRGKIGFQRNIIVGIDGNGAAVATLQLKNRLCGIRDHEIGRAQGRVRRRLNFRYLRIESGLIDRNIDNRYVGKVDRQCRREIYVFLRTVSQFDPERTSGVARRVDKIGADPLAAPRAGQLVLRIVERQFERLAGIGVNRRYDELLENFLRGRAFYKSNQTAVLFLV